MSYQLIHTPEGVTLTLPSQAKWRAFLIDFRQGTIRYRYEHLQGRNELIAKAIGWKKGQALHVFDTTAGLGREAFLLAGLGCEVTLFERHQAISQLLKDALYRASLDPALSNIISRMKLIESCAIEHLRNHPPLIHPDVIYCDPMFEARSKSAAVKKEMQLLQTVVGCDLDAQQLVEVAWSLAKKRVVIKRAYGAPILIASPSLVFKAKSHRFDVYIKP